MIHQARDDMGCSHPVRRRMSYHTEDFRITICHAILIDTRSLDDKPRHREDWETHRDT